MRTQLDQVTPETLARLNREAIRDHAEILVLLRELWRRQARLDSGINARNQPRHCTVAEVRSEHVLLAIQNFDRPIPKNLYINFSRDEERYFFSCSVRRELGRNLLEVNVPTAIFRAERRDLHRRRTTGRIWIATPAGKVVAGTLRDRSKYGLAVDCPDELGGIQEGSRLRIRFSDDSQQPEKSSSAIVRHVSQAAQPGWRRLGVALTEPAGDPIPLERSPSIVRRRRMLVIEDKIKMAKALGQAFSGRLEKRSTSPGLVPIVEYRNDRGQKIVAIVDVHGDSRGAPAVVIPPAWGRTKETLAPLALTILETFRAANQPVTIVRFDGTNRKGESYIDPQFRSRGDNYLGFTFSQAVRDLQSTIDFLHESPLFSPSKTVVVTFSIASVEARRVVALNRRQRIAGWISVVGMVDLQSGLRTISGGLDFAHGLAKGLRFGSHELVGVRADMDHTGLDALNHELVFLEEARRDFATINVPVTWFHGRHDAWMDLDRVRDVMSRGDKSVRRLVEIPTGHQLRTSSEALATFQLVAEEVSSMALGCRLEARTPDLRAVQHRREAERERLQIARTDLRAFWTDYLLGRDRRAGIELLTATSAYRAFMNRQVELLSLGGYERIADLGSGTGDLALRLEEAGLGYGLQIDQVDYVIDALKRGRRRLQKTRCSGKVQSIAAQLDIRKQLSMPARDGVYDRVLASLVLCYLPYPEGFLREVLRILKPGGVFVASSLKKDADLSRIFLDGVAELAPGTVGSKWAPEVEQNFEVLSRSFFNDACRILDLEEEGHFSFFDGDGLARLADSVGFEDIAIEPAFGEPAQAIIVHARKP